MQFARMAIRSNIIGVEEDTHDDNKIHSANSETEFRWSSGEYNQEDLDNYDLDINQVQTIYFKCYSDNLLILLSNLLHFFVSN